MPWCPKCKTEYQDGIEVCADCGATLVFEVPADKEQVAVAFISEEELAQKLVDYLGYSSIKAEYSFDETEDSFGVYVDEDKLEQAKVAFKAFYSVESKKQLLKDIAEAAAAEEAKADEDDDAIDFDEEILESIPEEEMSKSEKESIVKAVMAEQMYKPAEVYVKKSDESKEMFSTAITFLGFALVLLVMLVLNAMNIMTLFNNVPSLIMLGVLSIGCCLVGINSIKRSRNAEIASVEEDKLTTTLNAWLEDNVNDEMFASLDASELSPEILYLRRVDIIREAIGKEFPDLDENYVDALIEDYYNSHFEDEPEVAEEESQDSEEDE